MWQLMNPGHGTKIVTLPSFIILKVFTIVQFGGS